MRRAHASIDDVDGIGDDHDLNVWMMPFSGKQRLGKFAGQQARIFRSGALEIVEKEHVHEDEPARAMDELNEREKHILSERRLKEEPATLEQLSKVYGISRERVRQIEARAFEKLQKSMHAAAQLERESERAAIAEVR